MGEREKQEERGGDFDDGRKPVFLQIYQLKQLERLTNVQEGGRGGKTEEGAGKWEREGRVFDDLRKPICLQIHDISIQNS